MKGILTYSRGGIHYEDVDKARGCLDTMCVTGLVVGICPGRMCNTDLIVGMYRTKT